MLTQLLIFTAGLAILYVGAESLVRGASAIASRYGIRPIIIGVTVIALGTSMPEFVVNIIAVFTGENDLALGNIVGSNITNTGLILGISALIAPLAFAHRTLRIEYPMMMGSLVIFYLLALNGRISELDGLILVVLLIAFMTYMVRNGRNPAAEDPSEVAPKQTAGRHGRIRRVVYVVAGMVLLAGGARLMVYSATNIAVMFGIRPIVIGLTVVAIGTSLPEIATAVVSVLREETDLLVGNVLGSNLLNVLFVVGVIGTINPLSVEPSALELHFPVMLLINIVLLPIAWTGRRISRFEGALLVASFLTYLVYLLLPYF